MKVMRGDQVIALLPIDPARVTVEQNDNMSLSYRYQKPKGEAKVLAAKDIFHIRGFTLDGICGRSMVKQAAEAIGLALQAERAAARLFKNGMIVGGVLKHKGKLSPEAYDRLKASMDEREGSEQANKWMILEEAMEADTGGHSAKDSQHLETRSHQVEEIARVFGVPRPLLMVDETSWGSGIDVLGQLFVRYGLNPWFTAWEQAINRDLLSRREEDQFYAKFNAGGLLRGSMKDMADFFAKGLGAGGHHPFLHPDEARDWLELGHRDDLPVAVSKAKEANNDDPQRTQD
ncbi:phage portal protein [Paracoccus methylarcula]|uniref:Phage portal protein n=1 Tax=Paracoccus methylarcula TaxID=72022 RepID=A0A3R7LGA0_9RHOB|nr:phage portal protein [Paracoccus methylarcula]